MQHDWSEWPVAPRFARHESGKTHEYKWRVQFIHWYSRVLLGSSGRPQAGFAFYRRFVAAQLLLGQKLHRNDDPIHRRRDRRPPSHVHGIGRHARLAGDLADIAAVADEVNRFEPGGGEADGGLAGSYMKNDAASRALDALEQTLRALLAVEELAVAGLQDDLPAVRIPARRENGITRLETPLLMLFQRRLDPDDLRHQIPGVFPHRRVVSR